MPQGQRSWNEKRGQTCSIDDTEQKCSNYNSNDLTDQGENDDDDDDEERATRII